MAFSLGSRLVKNQPLADYLSKVGQSFSVIELHADPSFLSPHFTYNISSKKDAPGLPGTLLFPFHYARPL